MYSIVLSARADLRINKSFVEMIYEYYNSLDCT